MVNNMENWAGLEEEIITCRRCPRLVEWREAVSIKKRKAFKDFTYWGKPVPGFGDKQGRIMVVGLAPGAHGSNRTSRMFTGDASGDFLYPALFRNGFANQPFARDIDDGLTLNDIFITAICRCVPPDNKPKKDEVENCQPFLLREIGLMKDLEGFVVLGRIAFDNVMKIYKEKGAIFNNGLFRHGNLITSNNGYPWVLSSYHPSRQNTQTGRLTVDMFDKVWQITREKLST